jgi:2-polyprenyl-6-methoxyphenol hydroxylase-like FAD-dependent oxidoreductase
LSTRIKRSTYTLVADSCANSSNDRPQTPTSCDPPASNCHRRRRPSGLALGQLLHQRGIRATIYELRAKFTPEELANPSGMLDLHEESGLAAMRECGLWDGFQTAVGDCSESMRVINPDGAVLHTDEGELASRPEIARNALTNLLIQNVPSDIIKWNHKITTVRSNRNTTTGATEFTI